MTIEADSGARTDAELLFVAVDLGALPALEAVERNTVALRALTRQARMLVALPRMPNAERYLYYRQDRAPRRDALWRGAAPLSEEGWAADLRVARMSMASPWQVVLAEVARASSPVAYGGAALIALQQLLKMVMTWQQHRVELERAELDLQARRHELALRVMRESSTVVGQLASESADPATKEQAMTFVAQHPVPNDLLDSVENLNDVRAAELIPPDDPRATGR
ncbi:hypothetical protein [Amycolatopsis sp. NPDC004079]|uniref:hypothetical protein n=1 Tax=Amycolatopsis sp. NPDC004079 TaxID=3154549 RepID=UPI0033AA8CDF